MLRVLEPGDYFGKTRSCYKANGLAVAETEFISDLVIPRHEHVNGFFCFVLVGRGTRAWPGRQGGEAPMSLTFFPAAMPHENCWYGAGGHVVHVEFDRSWAERLRGHARVFERAADFAAGAPVVLMRRLVYECGAPDSVTPLAVEGLALEMLAACERASPEAKSTGLRGRRRWLDRAEAMLRERCCEPLSLETIAAECNVSADYLCREFRARFGCTVGEYVRELRLAFACRQLADADMSLATIAEAAGFADQSHFTRVFRSRFGITPGAYRKSR